LSFAAGAGVGARFLRLWLRRRPPLLFFFLLSLNASYRPGSSRLARHRAGDNNDRASQPE
jgi:hypothetical protein